MAAGAEPGEGAVDDPLIRDRVALDGYEIECELGRGGMGVVYGARHQVIGKRAAIKVLTAETLSVPQATERFVQEARAVCAIGHPNIVDVFGFGALPDGRAYFIMEWLRGESLRQRMHRRPPLERAHVLSIVDGVALALGAAHRAGIIHRDLKPDNVFLVEADPGQPARVKLLDFGIAKLSRAAGTTAAQTAAGLVMGTPGYMSPEQVRGTAVDHRADIYALGIVLYELLCDVRPFYDPTPVIEMARHVTDEPRRPSAAGAMVAPALEALVMRMLAKDPGDRPSLDDVRAGLADRPVVAARRVDGPLAAARASLLDARGGWSGAIALDAVPLDEARAGAARGPVEADVLTAPIGVAQIAATPLPRAAPPAATPPPVPRTPPVLPPAITSAAGPPPGVLRAAALHTGPVTQPAMPGPVGPPILSATPPAVPTPRPRTSTDAFVPPVEAAPVELSFDPSSRPRRGGVDAGPVAHAVTPRAAAVAALRAQTAPSIRQRRGVPVVWVAVAILALGGVAAGAYLLTQRAGGAAAPHTGAAQGPGRLVLDVRPGGVRVLVDGRPYVLPNGRATIELPPGPHVVEIERPGGGAVTDRVLIVAGEDTHHTVDLRRRDR